MSPLNHTTYQLDHKCTRWIIQRTSWTQMYTSWIIQRTSWIINAPDESHNVPAKSYSVPVESYSVPVKSYNVPVESYTVSDEYYGAPTESHNLPIESNGVPVKSWTHPLNIYGTIFLQPPMHQYRPEKLVVCHLIKKFPCFMVRYRFRKIQPLVPNPSQVNAVQTLISHSILSSHPRLRLQILLFHYIHFNNITLSMLSHSK